MAVRSKKARADASKIGLALAGGGPLGGIYEVGALIAIDEALQGVDLHDLGTYVGISAGSLVAGYLANRFSIAQIARILITNESANHPIKPSVFLRPALREYWRGAMSLPAASLNALFDFARRPLDTGVLGALASLQRCIPNAIFDNDPLRAMLADMYSTRGHSDDFRKLKQRLFVVASDLDSGEAVVFGSPGHDDVPISTAIQASTALPGLYPPVDINGRSFVDGALLRTLHATAALDNDVDLLFCVNPIVPYDSRPAAQHITGQDRLATLGLPTVLSQSMRALIHSRMEIGMERYADTYPDKDVILFEPKRKDSKMFFSNPFSYSNRRKMCEHAYQSTRADLLARHKELKPILAKHNVSLNTRILRDTSRNFATGIKLPTDLIGSGRYKNPVTNRLSDALDKLRTLLD